MKKLKSKRFSKNFNLWEWFTRRMFFNGGLSDLTDMTRHLDEEFGDEET